MTIELALPKQRTPALAPPSRIALDMAFGVGAGAVLGDKSRYNAHGAITTATWVPGLHGYCLNFVPGNPDYVTIPAAHAQLDFTIEDFSIIMRVYIDSLAAQRKLLQRGLWATDGYDWNITAAGRMDFYTYQGGPWQQTTSSNGDFVINTWYTVGLSRAGANITLYQNGVDITNIAGIHINPLTSARNFYIGIHNDLATNPFDGRIEFLRIFRGVELIGSEHLAWHNALA